MRKGAAAISWGHSGLKGHRVLDVRKAEEGRREQEAALAVKSRTHGSCYLSKEQQHLGSQIAIAVHEPSLYTIVNLQKVKSSTLQHTGCKPKGQIHAASVHLQS